MAGQAVWAQQDTVGIRTIIARQGKFSENYPVEKIFVHTDKPYYAAGDTIWLKAYVTVDLHLPTSVSKIVYVDIISSGDTLMQSLKLPVINGLAQGNIALPPDVYKQGNYHLRGYTNYMRNFDADYFFYKNIPIGNADKPLSVRALFTPANNSGTTAARVIYRNADGTPLAGKKVSWRIENLEKTLDKGHGTTDQNGVLQLSVPPSKSAEDGPAVITASIETDAKKTITNSFTVKAPARKDNDVQFFPEGGHLIAGTEGKVAFKALQSNGLGIEVKGTVTDNDGKTCATFTSQHLGMGMFLLLPENGKTYKATVSFPNGSQQTYNLPAVQQSGIGLAVNSSMASAVAVRILTNQAYLDQNLNKPYYLIAKVGETVVYAAQTTLKEKTYDVLIPKAKLVSGVTQITLLDDHARPLAERLAFVQNNDALNVAVRTDKPSYTRRQKVKLTVSAKNKLQPAEANFSVAVVNDNMAPYDENSEPNILSYLLLTSDLKGYIEQPGYYFNHQDNNTLANLDVLMLTQGYRRYTYTDLMAGRMPQIRYGAEQGIEVTGTLRTNTGMPVNKGSVRLTIADRHFSQNATTDGNGVFRFTNIPLVDSSQVVISARGNYRSNSMMLMVDPMTVPNAMTGNAPDAVADIDSTYRNYIKNSKQQYSNSRMLKEVVIKGQAPVKLPSHADYPALTGLSPIADHVINAKSFEGCNNLLSCLPSLVIGLTYIDNNFYVTRSYNQGNRTPVQIFMNGLAVDVNALNGISPSDVLSAEIFVKDDLGLVNRMYNSNGVLVINTKSAALKNAPKTKISVDELKNMLPRSDEVTITPQGYSLARQFYIPKYEVGKTNGVGIDLRTTVYWNPQLKTDKTTGTASAEFFNSDGKGNYRVVVQGIDAEGHLGYTVFKYKVE
ncbi:TonB-dependent receptor plug domain-containing protein [Mucilaginibacter koreensis]